MKLRNRILIASACIVVVPLILFFGAFALVGSYMSNPKYEPMPEKADLPFNNTIENYDHMTKTIMDEVETAVKDNSERIEDTVYLSSLNGRLAFNSSFIIVRKGEDIYYSGNPAATDKIFASLPVYANVREGAPGIYLPGTKRLIKQVDFIFSDGAKGSFFIVTRMNSLFSGTIILYLFPSLIIILLVTSFALSWWIMKSVCNPVNELNVAMQSIAEGNFEYRLLSDAQDEFGELYRNYEDMRLRLKESADEKLEQEKRNKELISNITHDLKTPMTAVKGYVEGIMDGVADTPEKMDRYIKTIYNKTNDMDRLINELTIFSGIDANRIPYHFCKLDISEYFSDCIDEVGLELESKDIKLNFDNLVSPGTQIIADPEQIKRVINNIVSNSIKYMDRRDGMIDIRLLDEVDSVRIEIEDNGKGIAPKDLANIFERFYRTDASRNSTMGGSGIGLSIVKKIVEDHGGYIWATSKEGEGTCMHIVIRKYIEPDKE